MCGSRQPIGVPSTRPVRRLARHMPTISLPWKITLMRDRVVKTTPAGGPSIVLDGVKNPTTNIRIVRTGSVNVRMPVRISTVRPALRGSRVKLRIKINCGPVSCLWRRSAHSNLALRDSSTLRRRGVHHSQCHSKRPVSRIRM